MEEKLLSNRKNGMPVLLLVLVLYVAAVLGCVVGASMTEGDSVGVVYGGVALLVVCIAWLALGWILLCGLKVLKPQEALVLTLFGRYIGTLKGEGFYFVNPFCSAVNPAARTRLNQSGDVNGGGKTPEIGRAHV